MLQEVKYKLPFDTTRYELRISQGNNGPWSHKVLRREIPKYPGNFIESCLTYATDFALPYGTEVRAARSGEVFMQLATSRWYYEGLDPEIGNNPPPLSTNFIVILHEDKTMAWYSHLSCEVLKKRGDRVREGEVIALTGKSGWVAEVPHLHFHVDSGEPPQRSIPQVFEDYQGSLDHETLLKEGKIWFGE